MDGEEMDGEKFEQAWHAVTPSLAVRERRSRKFGQPGIGLKLMWHCNPTMSG